jgi:hypothetical protein
MSATSALTNTEAPSSVVRGLFLRVVNGVLGVVDPSKPAIRTPDRVKPSKLKHATLHTYMQVNHESRAMTISLEKSLKASSHTQDMVPQASRSRGWLRSQDCTSCCGREGRCYRTRKTFHCERKLNSRKYGTNMWLMETLFQLDLPLRLKKDIPLHPYDHVQYAGDPDQLYRPTVRYPVKEYARSRSGVVDSLVM